MASRAAIVPFGMTCRPLASSCSTIHMERKLPRCVRSLAGKAETSDASAGFAMSTEKGI
jgi:hypothetical protein